MSEPESAANNFYRRSMELLLDAQVPFLLGGAYAFCVYTGIARHTKDFDIFVRQADYENALEVFRRAGYRAENSFPHWLGKAFHDDESIDIIFSSGNGICPVDDLWFERAPEAEVFGLTTWLSPPEEMIWMKAFIMERERYDGADVAHLLFHCAPQLDWDHLFRRFGENWRVLLSHLILFGYIYPTEQGRIPKRVLTELLGRLSREDPATGDPPLCRGPLLSRTQFLTDIGDGSFRDPRLDPGSGMSAADVESWTAAVDPKLQPRTVEPEN